MNGNLEITAEQWAQLQAWRAELPQPRTVAAERRQLRALAERLGLPADQVKPHMWRHWEAQFSPLPARSLLWTGEPADDQSSSLIPDKDGVWFAVYDAAGEVRVKAFLDWEWLEEMRRMAQGAPTLAEAVKQQGQAARASQRQAA